MKAVYKCRLCGERFHNGAETGPDVAERCMIEMNVGIVGTVAMAPNKTDTHHCGGAFAGSLGLADFLGWMEVPKNRRRQRPVCVNCGATVPKYYDMVQGFVGEPGDLPAVAVPVMQCEKCGYVSAIVQVVDEPEQEAQP